MNARQKAKKYKRMYEELLNRPVRFKVEQHKIDTLKFEKLYPEAFATSENNIYLRDVIMSDIAQCLASRLDKYIDFNIQFCPHMHTYRLYGEIEVVDRLQAESEVKNE